MRRTQTSKTQHRVCPVNPVPRITVILLYTYNIILNVSGGIIVFWTFFLGEKDDKRVTPNYTVRLLLAISVLYRSLIMVHYWYTRITQTWNIVIWYILSTTVDEPEVTGNKYISLYYRIIMYLREISVSKKNHRR